MADSTLVHYSGTFVFHNGDIAEGALLTVYDAGTSNLASIYADADLTTAASTNGDGAVVADANGLLPFVWIGTQDYKVRLTTADDVLIDEQDNLTGALDLAPFQAGQFASPSTAFTARTADYSMDSDDIGTAISCDPTGGSFTVTLMSAVTVGNGKGVTIDHVGSDNAVSIVTSSSQTISFAAEARERIVLPAYGASVQLVSDGANWHVVGDVKGVTAPFGLGIIRITDRVSSAPTPSAGDLYLVSSAFSTFSAGDIIEYNGSDYNVYTPPTDSGWVAYVQDEDRYYAHKGSAWTDVLNTLRAADMPAGSIVGRVYAEYTANAALATALPCDDTIPASTEGTQVLSAAITLGNASNRVRARFQGQVAELEQNLAIGAALFRSTTCVGATFAANLGGDEAAWRAAVGLTIEIEEAPGSVGPHTYTVRVGSHDGTSVRMNGTTSSRFFGGASRATLVLEEIQV